MELEQPLLTLPPPPPPTPPVTCDLTIVVGEAHAEVSLLDLLQEHVLLVQEEDDGGGGEVAVVTDAVEQVETLVHSILKGNDIVYD